MNIYVCIYIYVCMYIYIHNMYIYICTYTYIYIIYIRIWNLVCIYIYICIWNLVGFKRIDWGWMYVSLFSLSWSVALCWESSSKPKRRSNEVKSSVITHYSQLLTIDSWSLTTINIDYGVIITNHQDFVTTMNQRSFILSYVVILTTSNHYEPLLTTTNPHLAIQPTFCSAARVRLRFPPA